MLRVEYISKSKELLSEQILAFEKLLSPKQKIVIFSPYSLFRYFPSKKLFVNNKININVGDTIDFYSLKLRLTSLGYENVKQINASLQYAYRGNIIDVFSLNYDNPIRIEFFDNVVESIRFFDVSTQLSISRAQNITLLPANIYFLTEEEINSSEQKIYDILKTDILNLNQNEKEELESQIKDDLNEIKTGYISQKNYKYIGLLQDFHYSLLDYLDNFEIILSNKDDYFKNKNSMFLESHQFLSDLCKSQKTISHLSYFNERLDEFSKFKNIINLTTFNSDSSNFVLDIHSPSFNVQKTKELYTALLPYIKNGYKILCLTSSLIEKNDLILCLNKNIMTYKTVDSLLIDENFNISIFDSSFPFSFELRNEKCVVLSSYYLFNKKSFSLKYSNKFKEGVILNNYQDLEIGDYVVHEYKGIGQYLGIQTLEIDNKKEDYLQILYANNTKVYIPLYQFNLVRKYIGKDGKAPTLSSLQNDKRKKTKKRIKEEINELAIRLLNLYQERSKIQGIRFDKDNKTQIDFENSFEYELTKDQAKSLNEIKQDMESSHPMDRLLCGDVGFGKTEVAFRAIMKAVLSGKQACFLCPTTLLAKQHYELATNRFKNFNLNIGMLSRLQSQLENEKTKKLVSNGSIDLIIGTHMLLSKNITFNNLGLLIIDEEQRFGVEQKEKIKELLPNIDILSLSATPIPRTLQTSLIGLKSISTIETPPENKLPIQTYVIQYDIKIIKDIILKELGRGGQVFYVFNNITLIYKKAEQLSLLLPNINIGVVHGKMNSDDIDKVMSSFYNNELDVLISTSIIENGIDIKNANLIIIENANLFGLSQLYQIKGRVGRGDRLAFAYLTIPSDLKINDEAKKRLKAIQDFTELGSGYKIAQRDLLIRGAGDILGPKQAGFINDVGIDLYLKLLNESIEENKTGKLISQEEPIIKTLSFEAYIPSSFANNKDKLELYQNILNAKTIIELNEINKKIADMFGTIPKEFVALFLKRKFDIYIKTKDVFSAFNEYENKIVLTLTYEFSSFNGIGTTIFTSLFAYLNEIKISYRNKKIEIAIKKNTNWYNILINVMESLIKINKTIK